MCIGKKIVVCVKGGGRLKEVFLKERGWGVVGQMLSEVRLSSKEINLGVKNYFQPGKATKVAYSTLV